MTDTTARVTVHMVASLDGFVARTDGRVDWMETADEFAGGEAMDPESVRAFLASIDCYVMGSRTYETALAFETRGLGWVVPAAPGCIAAVLTPIQQRIALLVSGLPEAESFALAGLAAHGAAALRRR